MGHAILLKYDFIDIENDAIRLQANTVFFDKALNINTMQNVDIRFDPDATPAQMETAIINAVIDAKNQFFPTMPLPRTKVIFHDIKRGV